MKQALLIFTVLLTLAAQAQKMKKPGPAPVVTSNKTEITKADLVKLNHAKDSLRLLAERFTEDTTSKGRQAACHAFIPMLVNTLKINNSFYYPMDSFATVSVLYPNDSSFRIFTWQLYFTTPVTIPARLSKTGRDTVFQKPTFRYYGAIQMRSSALKMFPLYDAGDTLSYGTQQVLGHNNWWGQLYYNIIQKTVNGKNYYTLFGMEVGDKFIRRKIIDVLTFDAQGQPKFGAKLFYINREADTLHYAKKDTLSRFFIEYKQNAGTILNYDTALEMIVFNHVAPPTEKGKGATFTYVPDGTYEGFKWASNRWNWVEKVFTFAINEDNNPPVPVPILGPVNKQPELPKELEKPE